MSRGQPTPQSAADFAAQSKQPKVPIRIGVLLELPGILCTSAPNDHFHRVKADELSKVTGPTIAARLQAAGWRLQLIRPCYRAGARRGPAAMWRLLGADLTDRQHSPCACTKYLHALQAD